VGGVPLYKAARAGRDVERESREVTVFRLNIVGIQIPDVTFRVACSKGTYIRTLCADMGDKLGVGGHLSTLVRERVGPLLIEQALTVDEVELRLKEGTLAASMLTLDQALAEHPACTVGAATARRVLHGMPVPLSEVLTRDGWPSAVLDGSNRAIRIKDEAGRLLAIGTLPARTDREKLGLGEQPIVVSKVMVMEESQGGRIANSLEE
jgi:tRNA pseudouridine55 synthase